MTIKEFAQMFLLLDELKFSEVKKGGESGHAVYGNLSKEQFCLMLFLMLRVHRANNDQVRYFVNVVELKELAGWGYIIVSNAKMAVFYQLSDKGRLIIEGLVNKLLANIRELDKRMNFINFDKSE